MKCMVCGRRLKLRKDNRYEIRKDLSPLAALVEQKKVYEAFDCQVCGCQNIVNERIMINDPVIVDNSN